MIPSRDATFQSLAALDAGCGSALLSSRRRPPDRSSVGGCAQPDARHVEPATPAAAVGMHTRAHESRRRIVMSTPAGTAAPAEAVVKKARGPSLVWIVPIVAAAAAGWLWYRTIQEQGPLITIRFHTADGLEAGKTKVKLKYVEAGLVETISIAPDLSHVNVGVRMEKSVSAHLNEQTRFWVVRPRFGVQGISGLGTIVSGAYIEMEPGGGGDCVDFEGLETPPISPNDAPGLKLRLHSERLASLDVGTSVFYRDVCVGLVESHALDPEGRGVTIDVYIQAPFAHLVRTNTCFFNTSGFELLLGADGVELRTEALE
jgi:paraquat-inducible protein B